MKAVDQQYLHDPEHGIYGDCLRAAIASIMELPIANVPHFVAEAEKDSQAPMSVQLNNFLKQFGLCYITVDADSDGAHWLAHNAGYHLIIGPSPRGVSHAVVGYRGDMVHDPHPSKAGLIEVKSFWYLVPLNPSTQEGGAK